MMSRSWRYHINFEQKRGTVHNIFCWNCSAMSVVEMGRCVKTRKREHGDAIRTIEYQEVISKLRNVLKKPKNPVFLM